MRGWRGERYDGLRLCRDSLGVVVVNIVYMNAFMIMHRLCE